MYRDNLKEETEGRSEICTCPKGTYQGSDVVTAAELPQPRTSRINFTTTRMISLLTNLQVRLDVQGLQLPEATNTFSRTA